MLAASKSTKNQLLLNELLDSIEQVKSVPSFTNWVNSSSIVIASIFGEDSQEYKSFVFDYAGAYYGVAAAEYNDTFNNKIPAKKEFIQTLIKVEPFKKKEIKQLTPLFDNKTFWGIIIFMLGTIGTLGGLYLTARFENERLRNILPYLPTTIKDSSYNTDNNSTDSSKKYDNK